MIRQICRAAGLGLTVLLGAAGAAPLRGQIHLQAANLFVYGGGYSAVHQAFNLKTGFDVGGGVGLEIHKYLELRAALTGAQSHLRVNGAETGTYLNRYYVGADVKAQYPLPSGLTPYGLVGGGVVILHEKGNTAGNQTQGFGHVGLGLDYPVWKQFSLLVQGDGFFYSLSGLSGGALSAYSSAQFDIAWSVGVSHRFAL
jgi:opacity protein-like surface antigen